MGYNVLLSVSRTEYENLKKINCKIYKMNNSFESFLIEISPRIGAQAAFDLARDAQLEVYKDLFIGLGVSKEEIELKIENQLKKTAQAIKNMPVLSPLSNSLKN